MDQLWAYTDTLPAVCCEQLDLPPGSTYAQAARKIKETGEFQAEVRNYVLWCEGRLEELYRAGMVDGQPTLTEAGRNEYRKLVASGFSPGQEKVIVTLKSHPHVPPEAIDGLAVLMLTHKEGGRND